MQEKDGVEVHNNQRSKSRFSRNVWAVTITSFLNDISSEMLLNLLPLFLFNVLGARTAVIGLIEGIAETTSSLLKILSGWFSDRLGSRKGLALSGYGLSTLAKPFLYFATSWSWVLGVRFVDRAGKGLRTAPRDALLADSVKGEQRGLAFGLHRAGDTAGAVLGLVIALVILLSMQGHDQLLTREPFQKVVLLSMIPAILAVMVLAIGAKDVKWVKSKTNSTRIPFKALDKRFRWFLIIVILFTLGNSSDAFLILRAQNAGLSVIGILGMMITFNLIYALISTPAGALSDRIGRKRLLVSGWLFYSLVYWGFAYAQAGWQTWALMAAYGLYYGLTDGVAKAFVADLIPSERRGMAFGAYNAAIGLTAFPASLIAGLLWQGVGSWDGFGPSAPFVFGAVLALLASGMLLLVLPSLPNEVG
jgi:MFS family permease